MNAGTFHFREAARLLRQVDGLARTDPETQPLIAQLTDEAGVHAKLAEVAVAARQAGLVHNTNDHPSDWWTALHGEERS